jgi:hypothetical protein
MAVGGVTGNAIGSPIEMSAGVNGVAGGSAAVSSARHEPDATKTAMKPDINTAYRKSMHAVACRFVLAMTFFLRLVSLPRHAARRPEPFPGGNSIENRCRRPKRVALWP